MKMSQEFIELFGNGLAADYIPILKHIPTPAVKKVKEFTSEFYSAINKELEEHRASYDGGEPKDLIEMLFQIRQEMEDEGSEDMTMFTETHIRQTVADVFGNTLRSITLANTLSALLLDGTMADEEIVKNSLILFLAGEIGNEWQDIGRYLKMPESELTHIKLNNRDRVKDAIHDMLLKWKQQNGGSATCSVLAAALQEAGRLDLSQNVSAANGPGRNIACDRLSPDNHRLCGMKHGVVDVKTRFIQQLKATYENWYNGIKPIPFFRNNNYSVNDLFVEGGIEFLGAKDRWEPLGSYRNIQFDQRLRSKRKIIEGEPGYGKTILSLLLAYQWSEGAKDSLLGDTEILLILKLGQLKGVKTLNDAIKFFLLPKDSDIETAQIDHILKEANSVVLLLDAYDEYPDATRGKHSSNFISNIINRHVCYNIDVITTTRTSCLPEKYSPITKRIKLVGFGKEAQDKYLKKAVTTNEAIVNEIKQFLEDNPILDDLCQVPLVFVMYAHLSAGEKEPTEATKNVANKLKNELPSKFASATIFFRYVMSCFYGHTMAKTEDENVESLELVEHNHEELDKLAFISLTGNSADSKWERSEMENVIGKDLLALYLRVGILRAEEVIEVDDTTGIYDPFCHIKRIEIVRFYHKLFCEWYAAHYLARNITSETTDEADIEEILDDLEPDNLQYVLRFACGLSDEAARHIIPHLQDTPGFNMYAVLCMLEQYPKMDNITKYIETLCSSEVLIKDGNTRVLNRSMILLLEEASSKKIPTNTLMLRDSFKTVDLNSMEIILKDGIRLPKLQMLQELWIVSNGNDLSIEVVQDIFEFVSQCGSLSTIRFTDCLLPRRIGGGTSPSPMTGVKVLWRPSVDWYRLNTQTGGWEFNDGVEEVTKEVYQSEMEAFLHEADSEGR